MEALLYCFACISAVIHCTTTERAIARPDIAWKGDVHRRACTIAPDARAVLLGQ